MGEKSDKRSQERSNVFLTAKLVVGNKLDPVRVRNLSPKGALVDGHSLPPVGTRVRLLRGQLHVDGELAWNGSGQAGINFDYEIRVGEWVSRLGNSGQQRIDQVVNALRGSQPVPGNLRNAEREQTLVSISMEMDEICARLADLPNLSEELGEDLVRLDALARSLRQLVAPVS